MEGKQEGPKQTTRNNKGKNIKEENGREGNIVNWTYNNYHRHYNIGVPYTKRLRYAYFFYGKILYIFHFFLWDKRNIFQKIDLAIM
jgi:hypothetical protein